jgi:hypothetical protein
MSYTKTNTDLWITVHCTIDNLGAVLQSLVRQEALHIEANEQDGGSVPRYEVTAKLSPNAPVQ